MKSYVRNTINLSWDKILLTSVIRTLDLLEMATELAEPHATELAWQYLSANK
jgi:hypothetical protein